MYWRAALKSARVQFNSKGPKPIIVRKQREHGVEERIIHIGPDRFAYWIGLPGAESMQETYARLRMTGSDLDAYLSEFALENEWEEREESK